MQRVLGHAQVSLRYARGATRLERLRQSGSAKAFLPSAHGAAPEVVFLNTAGGLTGGDRLTYRLDLADGGATVATTQTAERIYRAGGSTASVAVEIGVGSGAQLDWLPQETILFEGAALERRTRIAMAGAGRVLIAEMLVFGRLAMGETLSRLSLTDRRGIWRGGCPVWIDAFGLCDAGLAPRPALLAGARAVATLALVTDGAEDAAGPLRSAVGAEGEVSGWDGRCIARISAAGALEMKRAVARGLAVLRRGAALPRVWQI